MDLRKEKDAMANSEQELNTTTLSEQQMEETTVSKIVPLSVRLAIASRHVNSTFHKPQRLSECQIKEMAFHGQKARSKAPRFIPAINANSIPLICQRVEACLHQETVEYMEVNYCVQCGAERK